MSAEGASRGVSRTDISPKTLVIWKEREIPPDLSSWGEVSGINAGLTELGQVVCDVLKAEYVDWESEYEAPDDLPDFS